MRASLAFALVWGCTPSDPDDGDDPDPTEAGAMGSLDAAGPSEGGAPPPDAGGQDSRMQQPPPRDAGRPPRPDGCAPQCDGKMCGRDGCGGACGECPNTQFCKRGMCTELPAESAICEPCLTADSCVDAEALCVGQHPDKVCTRACACPGGGSGCESDACPEGMPCAEYMSGSGSLGTFCLVNTDVCAEALGN